MVLRWVTLRFKVCFEMQIFTRCTGGGLLEEGDIRHAVICIDNVRLYSDEGADANWRLCRTPAPTCGRARACKDSTCQMRKQCN